MSIFDNAIERINKIDWNNKCIRASHQLLVEEFMIRGNKLRDEFEKENTKRLAIFNLIDLINISIPDSVQKTIDSLNLIEHGWTTSSICENYLIGAYLCDEIGEKMKKCMEVFEPMIKLYERGGTITYHNNELICGKFSWPRNCYSFSRVNKFIDISDNFLDDYDLN